jgi:hypothetical protein
MEKEFLHLHLQHTIRIFKVFYRARKGVWVLFFLTNGFLFRKEFLVDFTEESNKSMRYPYK